MILPTNFFVTTIILLFILIFLASAIKIVKEYERAVIFRLGRVVGARGPGLFFIIPIFEKAVIVDLRTQVLDVPVQETITKDNVPVRVNAVVYFRVVDPVKAVTQVKNYIMATSQISQTTLRSVIGQAHLDELLSERDKLNMQLQRIIDEATDPWGIKVTAVEIKDVELPAGMQRAMAKQAEAERERRARITLAEAERQAAEKLREAAEIISEHPMALQLRTLQTISDVASDKSNVIVLMLPMEMLKLFKSLSDAAQVYAKKEKEKEKE
ncbi:slipin family protein [Pyrococcus abyssi]|uniref:Stomatin homolog PYRAB06580 n=1 Tax=Pyrococcus abyssi (strain GE5 / Orsay) TaxID=272844 RepID=PSTOM_PYRAB|nr:slipin family protein [Pyrococcus abyssi]Q9V0Y1.1 RecName: Full=Stomatin homolog PYRAB06580; AltName: Full=Prokaryotic stomatin; Short=P-stomatin [Pyrococcus abyssi GE5]CAB49571.1 Stomatin-like protein [Pyrococcus abyssi GE5]CCE70043.1 TPA: stomatin-like protein [Pyrococcus abyssi GE5]